MEREKKRPKDFFLNAMQSSGQKTGLWGIFLGLPPGNPYDPGFKTAPKNGQCEDEKRKKSEDGKWKV